MRCERVLCTGAERTTVEGEVIMGATIVVVATTAVAATATLGLASEWDVLTVTVPMASIVVALDVEASDVVVLPTGDLDVAAAAESAKSHHDLKGKIPLSFD